MSAMSDLDVTLQLGEPTPCECGSERCEVAAIVTHFSGASLVTLAVMDTRMRTAVTIELTPRTAAALAILLDEAARDAAGD